MGILDSLGLGGGGDIRKQVTDAIEEVIKDFAMKYQKAFRTALIHKILDDAVAEKKDDKPDRELTAIPGSNAPDKEGPIKRQSTILKRWKPLYAKVNERFEILLSSEKGKKESSVINLWGYTADEMSERPQGKRKGGPQWVKDKERSNCNKCKAEFKGMTFKHHCRGCGEIFCDDCTPHRASLTFFGYEEPQRVCEDCLQKIADSRKRMDTVVGAPPELLAAGAGGAATELKADAFYGLHLTHPTRTPWVLEFESKEEREDWLKVIQICIKNSKPPRNADEVLAQSFEAAHRAAFREIGMPGRWRITGNEAEMLTDLVSHQLNAKIVGEICASLSQKIPEKYREKASNLIKQKITVIVALAVEPGWKLATAGILKIKDVLVEKLTPVLAPAAKARKELQDKIKDAALDVILPIAKDVVAPVLNKVLDVAAKPLLQMHSSMYEVFLTQADNIANKAQDADSVAKAAKEALAAVRGEHPYLHEVYKSSHTLAHELRAAKKDHEFLNALEVTASVNGLLKSVHGLLNNAIYTLSVDEQWLKGDLKAGFKEARARVATKLLHDSQKELVSSIEGLLNTVLVPNALRVTVESDKVKAITDPMDELIPDMVKDFISVDDTLQEIVTDVVTESVNTSVTAGSSDDQKALANAMAASLARG